MTSMYLYLFVTTKKLCYNVDSLLTFDWFKCNGYSFTNWTGKNHYRHMEHHTSDLPQFLWRHPLGTSAFWNPGPATVCNVWVSRSGATSERVSSLRAFCSRILWPSCSKNFYTQHRRPNNTDTPLTQCTGAGGPFGEGEGDGAITVLFCKCTNFSENPLSDERRSPGWQCGLTL